MAGTLYVVATPIGNMDDISSRAKNILASVGRIAAEDTRRTGLLLKRLGIKGDMVSYHEHNEAARTPQLLQALDSGMDVALVTDAGTPAISDPGYRLVKAAADKGMTVSPVPGPSAVIAALSVSGLPSDRFLFEGFLPRKKGRQTRLRSLAGFKGTVILFESPLRLAATLRDVLEHFGNRRAVVGRELTKLHETLLRGTVEELLEAVETRAPKGECVLLVAKEGLS